MNCFDTAPLYGESEQIIGRALAELGIADKVTVVTKTEHMSPELSPQAVADEMIETSVVRSLKYLGLDALPICLFHREDNFRYVEGLVKLKEHGLIRHVGSSLNTPEISEEVISSGLAEAVQLPANMLDNRFTRSGIIEDARTRGKAVFVRSVYLQGLLLLLPDDEIPEDLVSAIPVLQSLRRIARDAGMQIAELAARYVMSIPGVTCCVVGCETVEQMRENVELFSRARFPLMSCTPSSPPSPIFPATW